MFFLVVACVAAVAGAWGRWIWPGEPIKWFPFALALVVFVELVLAFNFR